jgi:small ligand-binding sensory domain FIST
MKFGCAASREPDTVDAGEYLLEDLFCRFAGPCDLAVVFFTPHHLDDIEEVIDGVSARLAPRCLIGCSCEGVIGGELEIERRPGISILAGSMPGVRLQPFHMDRARWASAMEDPGRLAVLARPQADTRAFIALADPFTTPIEEALGLFASVAPGVPVIGGMASGGGPGENVLLMDDHYFTDGFLGLTISGPVQVDTVVSQGGKPVGRPLLVTRAEGSVIEELGGEPALEVLRRVVSDLGTEDRALVENGVFLGVVINEYQAKFGRGDFLVRGIPAADPDTGAIVIAGSVDVGQTVQLHLIDAASADEDLRLLMKRQGHGHLPVAGLLFSCNGRGERLFDRVGHDIAAVLDAAPTTPVAGFFAAGELGPVGKRSFIHGHTASIALLRELA